MITKHSLYAHSELINVLSFQISKNKKIDIFFDELEKLLYGLISNLVNEARSDVFPDSCNALSALQNVCAKDCEIGKIINENDDFIQYLFKSIQGAQNDTTYIYSREAIWLLRELRPQLLFEVRGVHGWIANDLLRAVSDIIEREQSYNVCNREAIEVCFDVLVTHRDNEGLVKTALYLMTRATGPKGYPSRLAVEYMHSKNVCEMLVHLTSQNPALASYTAELVISLATVNEVRSRLLSLGFHSTLMANLHTAEHDSVRKWILYSIATIGGPASIIDLLKEMSQHEKLSENFIKLALHVIQNHVRDFADKSDFEDDYIKVIEHMTSYLKAIISQSSDQIELIPHILSALRLTVYKQMSLQLQIDSHKRIMSECMETVFCTMKTLAKNELVVRYAVELIGYILDDVQGALQITDEAKNSVMNELRAIQAHHLSSSDTQHWILWTALASRGLSTMLGFMKTHESSAAVQFAAISSINEYYQEDMGRTIDCGEEYVDEAASIISNGVQLHYLHRTEGVRALALLGTHKSSIPVEITKNILRVMEHDDDKHRAACIYALRTLTAKWPTAPIPPNSLQIIHDHLVKWLPASHNPGLFCDGLWILANCRGYEAVCEFLDKNYRRGTLFRCAFQSLTDLFRVQGVPNSHELGRLPEVLDYGMREFPDQEDVQQAAQMLYGFLAGTQR